jgi:hypothetical protein
MAPANNSSEPLAIIEVRYDTARQLLVLSWASRPGKSYSVEMSSQVGAWQTHAANIQAFGGKTTFEIARRWLSNVRFFRVKE